MKNYEREPSNIEFTRTIESDKSTFVKRSASGKTEYEESEYTIIEKELNDSNESNTKSIDEPSDNMTNRPSTFGKLLNALGTEMDLYKCFRLTEDQSVLNIYNF